MIETQRLEKFVIFIETVLSFVLSRKIKKDEFYEFLEEVVSSKISGVTLTFFALLW